MRMPARPPAEACRCDRAVTNAAFAIGDINVDNSFPTRGTEEAREADRELVRILEEMVASGAAISARAVAGRMSRIRHASTLTRDAWRMARIVEAEERRVRVAAPAPIQLPSSTEQPSEAETLNLSAIRGFIAAAHAANVGRA